MKGKKGSCTRIRSLIFMLEILFLFSKPQVRLHPHSSAPIFALCASFFFFLLSCRLFLLCGGRFLPKDLHNCTIKFAGWLGSELCLSFLVSRFFFLVSYSGENPKGRRRVGGSEWVNGWGGDLYVHEMKHGDSLWELRLMRYLRPPLYVLLRFFSNRVFLELSIDEGRIWEEVLIDCERMGRSEGEMLVGSNESDRLLLKYMAHTKN